MALNIPTESNCVELTSDTAFTYRDWYVVTEVEELMSTGKRFLGTTVIACSQDLRPVLVAHHGNVPLWFKEGAIYFEGDPVPRLIEPYTIHLKNFAITVYIVDVL